MIDLSSANQLQKDTSKQSGTFERRLGIRGYQGILVNIVQCDDGPVVM